MIFDTLENMHQYALLGERFAVAFAYLIDTNLTSLELGKHEIMDSEVFALVSEYQTKPLDISNGKHIKNMQIFR